MSEYESMSDRVRQFASLRREREVAGDVIRRRAAENAGAARAAGRRDEEWLRTLVRALAELCLEKGLIAEQELRDRIAKIDADDAARAAEARAAARARRTPRK